MINSYIKKKYIKLSLFIEKNFFYIYFVITFLKNFPVTNFKIIYKAYSNELRIINKKFIVNNKKSKTMFILGGGDSINDINKVQWEEINQSDSLGINRWSLHKHNPTYMLIEGAKKSDLKLGEEAYEYNYFLLNKSIDGRQKTTFIFKDTDSLYIDFKKLKMLKDRTYLMLKLIIPGKSIIGLRKSLKIIGKYSFFKNLSFPLGSRTSVTHALSFAILAGYENIVLCGIDLQGAYFWEKSNAENLIAEPPDWWKAKTEDKALHKTMEYFKHWELKADEIIFEISQNIKNHENQKIFVNSNKSLLSKYFPVYWDNK